MKKFLLTTFILFIAITGKVYAKVITVSNTSTSPGQYTDLQFVCDSIANSGDTILVSGSNIGYGRIVLNKSLTLLGTGYNPQKVFALVSRIDGGLVIGANNCDIEGFDISDILYGYSSDYSSNSNCKIARNIFGSISTSGGLYLTISNSLIVNNIIKSTFNLFGNNNVVMNNIFAPPYHSSFNISNISNTSILYSNLVFANNTILADRSYGYSILDFSYALVSNNIFYLYGAGDNFVLCSTASTSSMFANNVVYNDTVSNPFNLSTGLSGNTGSGNKYNIDPKFTTLVYDANNNIDAIASNFFLQSKSTVFTAGTDGKQPGIYGGSTPFQSSIITGNPAIPQISSMLLNKIVAAPGDTLQISLQAKSFK